MRCPARGRLEEWGTMHEARHTEERGWYVVDPFGHVVHVHEDGVLRAAFFGDDQAAAQALAARLNRLSEPRAGG